MPIEDSDTNEITYHYAGYDTQGNAETAGITESSVVNSQTVSGISGFKLSDATFEYDDENGVVYTYSATNTQIAYALNVSKISSASTSGSPYYLAGAEFTLYEDSTCENVVKTNTSTGTDVTVSDTGEIWLGYLEPGTYYLRETKAPDGYLINNGMWKIVISLDTYGNSTFTVTLVNDQETGAEIANTPGVELPDNGSFGAIWFMLIGAALMLFAALLLRRQYALARR